MGARPVPAVIIQELKKYLNVSDSDRQKLFDDNFNYKRWKKICKKAELFGLKFHDLRKTFCSVLPPYFWVEMRNLISITFEKGQE